MLNFGHFFLIYSIRYYYISQNLFCFHLISELEIKCLDGISNISKKLTSGISSFYRFWKTENVKAPPCGAVNGRQLW